MEEPLKPKKPFYSRILRSYRSLPQKKQYVEFFTAILTVPVLLTVIILNISNLKKSDTNTIAPTPVPQKIIVTIPAQQTNEASQTSINTPQISPTATPAPQVCNKDIGPVNITNPNEGDTVTDNPVQITIDQPGVGYCAIVWSYRINGGNWSDYDNNSIAIYNPPKGQITFDLRIKSTVTGEQKIETRKFIYAGSTTDQTASSSATTGN